MAVVQIRINDRSWVDGEEAAIKERVGGGEVEGRVCLVCSLIKEAISIDDLGDLVLITEAIIRLVDVNGHVRSVPDVCKPHGNNDRERNEHSHKSVERGEEWRNEWIPSRLDNIPVECGEWVQSQTGLRTSDRSQLDIVGCNPGHP